jgi:hypothetical protein
MESIPKEWPKMAYRLIVCGTTIECQHADEAVALANLILVKACEDAVQKEPATQN